MDNSLCIQERQSMQYFKSYMPDITPTEKILKNYGKKGKNDLTLKILLIETLELTILV